MPRPTSQPEHSRLEAQLLKTAAQIIARDGVDALSMRSLGKAAGVSRTAAYYYFPDKAALIARVGEDGFARLAQAVVAAARAEHDGGLAPLLAGFAAYLEFAIDEPDLYDVLARPLAPTLAQGGGFSSESAQATFDLLVGAITPLFPQDSAAALEKANMIWAYTHGIAMLAIGQHLKGAEPRALLRSGLLELFGKAGPA
jgi:AcrR family transcriptional regulator